VLAPWVGDIFSNVRPILTGDFSDRRADFFENSLHFRAVSSSAEAPVVLFEASWIEWGVRALLCRLLKKFGFWRVIWIGETLGSGHSSPVTGPDCVRRRASVFGADRGRNTPVMAGTGTYPEDCGSKAGFKRFQGSH
jgi:hypothetical protein